MKRLKEITTVYYEVKKSKFIGYLVPIENEEQAKLMIQKIKEEHPKATHHCVAYRIKSANVVRFDDDGEPQHTAGKPMLSVILAQDLDHALSVVVRYYGGVQLGRGGLVKAYTFGVASAISEATLITLQEIFDLSFDCPFDYAPQIEAYAHHLQAKVNTNYNHQSVHFKISLQSLNGVVESLNTLSKGTLTNIQKQSYFI